MATILIVEDNRDLADATGQLLTALGHDVTIARDGVEAMTEAARSRPETVLLDLGLPLVDGLEVARRLRLAYGSRMRLVAHTAWSDIAMRRRVIDAGFDRMIVKPAQLEELVEAVA